MYNRKTKWKSAYNDILEKINTQVITPDGYFYTVKELCDMYKISPITSKRVFQELKQNGLILTDGRRGTKLISKNVTSYQKKNVYMDVSFIGEKSNPFAEKLYAEFLEGCQSNIYRNQFDFEYVSAEFILSHMEELEGADVIISSESMYNHVIKNKDVMTKLKETVDPVVFHSFGVDERFYQVGNDCKGFSEAIGYFVKQGRKKIAFIAGDSANPWNTGQYKGFFDGMFNNGLNINPDYMEITNGGREENDRATERLLNLPNRPDAVILGNDIRALYFIDYCKDKIKIPDDIAIIGFDNITEGEFSRHKLTTFDPCYKEQGRKVLQLLKDRMEGKIKKPVFIKIKPKFIIRESA